jgi:manganese efflux pump family protein
MDIVSVILIAVGLAMDCLAISITSGIILKRFRFAEAFRIAFLMGLFQGLMPVAGWWLGYGFKELIIDFDHWIAFGVLLLLGAKMVYNGFSPEKEACFDPLNWLVLLGLAVATSIDAMAVGLSFAFLPMDVTLPFIVIGVITFLISFAGVFAGCKVGHKIPFPSEIFGGVILTLIGTKILIEHTLLT